VADKGVAVATVAAGRRSKTSATAASDWLFQMPNPFLGETGLLRMLEPPDSCAEVLRERLLGGGYDKPFLLEEGGMRYLYFSLRFVQSAMRLKDPDALDLAYTQKMMAFLLFNARPRNVLLLGLGGGSLAKFCYRHLPATQIIALELDPNVLALRDEFCVPADDHRFTVIQGDAARYVAEQAGRTDVIMVDTFDDVGVAPSLADGSFYEHAHRCLSANGIFVMNIAGDKAGYASHVDQICRFFGEKVIAMTVKDDGNFIVFAFKNPEFEPRWKWLKSIALELRGRFGLDFHHFAQQLERGQRLRLARRMAV
jgi:spermidine synthase